MRFPLLLAASLLAVTARAADYQGAAALLRSVDKEAERPAPAPVKGSSGELRADLKSFAGRLPTLSPADAGAQWLALLGRQLALTVAPLADAGPQAGVTASELFLALPPPDAWAALADGIAKLHPAGKAPDAAHYAALRVAAAALTNDDAAQWKALDGLKTALAGKKGSGPQEAAAVSHALAHTSDDSAKILASFEDELRLAAPAEDSGFHRNTLQVPALVRLAGKDRARALLKEIFTSAKHAEVSFDDDAETMALAREVATGLGGELKVAPWGLTHRLDATDLYETLNRQFPGKAERYTDRGRAGGYYLLGLIVKNRTDGAAAAAVKLADDEKKISLPDEPLRDLAQRGFAPEVAAFFGRLLTDHPELPYWDDYIHAASFAGEIEAVVDTLKKRVESASPAPAPLLGAYISALLAADHVPEGVKVLRERIASTPPDKAGAPEETAAASQAILLGRLLGDGALLKEGLDAFALAAKEQPSYSIDAETDAFLEAGRGPELEAALGDHLRKAVDDFKNRNVHAGSQYLLEELGEYAYRNVQDAVQTLVVFYGKAGRDEDVVTLLDRFPLWGVRDLAKISDRPSQETLYAEAKALAHAGRKEGAALVLNALLDAHGGSDPAYALLLELSPETAGARLDELFARDRFEERPLIWKARLALDRGRLDEAETLLRQAIAIDPSDGDEGRGDRMRGYALLAETLERKGGNDEEPKRLRGAVKAIRLSEEADRYHQAGLLTRAIAMYKEALGYFSDAYCIQSRLAIQLAAVGRMEEAEAHYTKAYELMPVSFGRVESHCFGCERAFAGERAQGIAERVFLKLTASQPSVPQNHYLLGYLREEQERNAEALESYREAVRLDPDYLNAWKKIASLAVKNSERSRANLMLLRLDPRGLHTSVELEDVADLAALWRGEEAAAASRPKPPEKIYPLAASAERLEEERAKLSANPHRSFVDTYMTSVRGWRHASRDTPVQAVLETSVLSSVVSLLDRSRGGDEATD